MILAGDIALWASFAGTLIFVVLYAVMAPWHRSEEGVMSMLSNTFMAILLGYVTYATMTRPSVPQSPLIRMLVFVGFALFACWRVSWLIRKQVLRNRKRARAGGKRMPG